MKPRKTLYTLNVNNYAPEITKLTYPLLKYYARKCGAEFYIISERRYPEWPVTYEKLQIYHIAEERQDDWSIYLDSDALVHPETLDWTNYISMDTVLHNGMDYAAVRWRYDKYFLRDGRHKGSCNWNTTASSWCRDLWHPVEDMTPEEAIDNIFPTVMELNTVITPDHLIDDYVLSRNIARYGLKTKTIIELEQSIIPGSEFYWHEYTVDIATKVKLMKDVIARWKVQRFY